MSKIDLLLLLAATSLAHGATPPETTVPGPPLDKVLAAAGLAHYLPKFKTYGVTTFIQAVGLDQDELVDEVGMNPFDQAIFARTMAGIAKAIAKRTRRTLPSSPRFTHPLCSLTCYIYDSRRRRPRLEGGRPQGPGRGYCGGARSGRSGRQPYQQGRHCGADRSASLHI